MPKFRYTAYDLSNQEKSGVVEALNQDLAIAQVRSMGLQPFNVKEEAQKTDKKEGAKKGQLGGGLTAGKKAPMVLGKVINAKGLTIFTRQMATLIQAGLPLLRALEVLERQEKNPAFKFTIGALADNIRSGNTLSDGLAHHPKIFDRLFVNMVKAGEAGGVLDTVLGRLAKFMEKAEKIKSRVKSAMVYPVIVLCVAILIVSALMIFVVPKFEQIFKELLKGEPLPVVTQILLVVSNFIKGHFIIAFLMLVLGFIAFVLFKKTEFGQKFLDRFYLFVPIFGDLVRKNAIARFSRTLGTLLQSGVPILDALRITRETIGNSVVMSAIDVVHDRVKEGEGVAGPLERTKVFPSMVTSMIDVGEETGELPEMLNRVADTYEEEVDNTVGAVTSIIEPIMIVGLALVVGFIVIALFMPMVTIIQKMTSG